MGLDRSLYFQAVIAADAVLTRVEFLRQQYPISLIVMGDQTAAQEWKQRMGNLSDPLRVVLVDERYTSLEARDRYLQLNTPKGWQRLLPKGLRQPDKPVDDIVAMILIERYLAKLVTG